MKDNRPVIRDNDPYKRAYRGSLAIFIFVFAAFLFRLSFVSLPEINAGEKIEAEDLNEIAEPRPVLNENQADSQKISPEKNIINDLTVPQKLVNINIASEEELCTLKGIGPKTAEAIVKYRNENGRFKCKDDLMKVKGIGKKKYSAVADKIIF